jgi:hypothetical protein
MNNNNQTTFSRKEYNKKWRLANKERHNEWSSAWHEKNKERSNKANADWYKKNKESVYERRKEKRKNTPKEELNKKNKELYARYRDSNNRSNLAWRKRKLKEDPLFAAKTKLRQSVNSSFRRIKQKKPTNTLVLLGCSWEKAKAHIESLFEEGMTWENHGTHGWHIDHIRPVADFKQEELHLMNHISNLQPLWATDNRNKSDSY